jgi:hypothetical protein
MNGTTDLEYRVRRKGRATDIVEELNLKFVRFDWLSLDETFIQPTGSINNPMRSDAERLVTKINFLKRMVSSSSVTLR